MKRYTYHIDLYGLTLTYGNPMENMNMKTFNELVNAAHKLDCKGVEYANTTGYFDGINQLRFEEGEHFTFTDTFNRRVLIIGHGMGPNKGASAIFERFADGDKGVLVGNINQSVQEFTRIPGSAFTTEMVNAVVSHRWEHHSDIKRLDKVVDDLIQCCASEDNYSVQCNDQFWVQEHAPWRLEEFSINYTEAKARWYPKTYGANEQ